MAQKLPGRTTIEMSEVTLSLVASATLAEVNAGKVIYQPRLGSKLTPVGIDLRVTGLFEALTDIRISSYDPAGGSPVDVATVAQAALTDGAKLNQASATMVLGAGFAAALTAGHGLQIRKTGSTATTATKVDVVILFTKTEV